MNLNKVQKLTGRIAALNKFLSKSTNKCIPFFRVLRKIHTCDEKCDKAFGQLNVYLSNPLSQAKKYQGKSMDAVSTALIREGKGAKAYLLYKSCLEGSRNLLPMYGVTGLHPSNNGPLPTTLLLGTPNNSPN